MTKLLYFLVILCHLKRLKIMKSLSVNLFVLLVLLKFLWNFNIPMWLVFLPLFIPLIIKIFIVTAIITMFGIWLKKK
jgi:hypothetical protein